MTPKTPEIVPTEEEARLGFEAQTLAYPEGRYELAGLKAPGHGPLDRTVAIVLDDGSRLRRRHGGSGYVLEVFDGGAWTVADLFETLREVEESGAFRDHRRQVDADVGRALEDETREAE
jgi:hypothetical protein